MVARRCVAIIITANAHNQLLHYVQVLLLLCIHSRIHTVAAFMMQSMADLSLNFYSLHCASVNAASEPF